MGIGARPTKESPTGSNGLAHRLTLLLKSGRLVAPRQRAVQGLVALVLAVVPFAVTAPAALAGNIGKSPTVVVASPTIVTTASASVPAGGVISDSAVLAGGDNATGTITFSAYGVPFNFPVCTTNLAFTSTVPVTGDGTYDSGPFTTAAAGFYFFVASYSGDANNDAVTSACGDTGENVEVTKASPALATTASGSATVGGTIADTAALTGGANPTGTVTFDLFGPDNATCAGPPVFTSTKSVTGSGSYTSDPFTTTAPGTYNFEASYSGDDNNMAIGLTACGAAGETVTVSNPGSTTTVVTSSANPSLLGAAVTFTATVAGSDGGGTVGFFADGSPMALSGCAALSLSVAGPDFVATCATSTLTAGVHPIAAAYSGDASFSASTGSLVDGQAVNEAPAITSAASAAFTIGASGSFTVTATGFPVPAITETGALPHGVTFNPATATVSGTPEAGTVGVYQIVFHAANGVGSPATQSFALTVNQAPAFTSALSTTFTVGIAGSFAVTATGSPAPTVAETGTLPAGVTFTMATATLSGTPAPGSAGIYPIAFTAANGSGVAATQHFTLTVNQAVFTYPTDGQTGVDTTHAFTWSTIPQAQSYIVVVGTTLYGTDLLNSGILPATQSSINVPALPVGPTLHATLLTKVNGTWTFQAITFTAVAGQGTFTYPTDGQAGIDPTHPFTWTTSTGAQGYILVVGTTHFGSDLANSGILPSTTSSFAVPAALPVGPTLYATLLTKVNGAFTRYQAITFTAGPARATLTKPTNGQTNVATPTAFTWAPIAGAQNYYLAVGTTLYGVDLVNSGVLAPTATSFPVPALPHGQTLNATLLTKVNGTWVFQAVTFTTPA